MILPALLMSVAAIAAPKYHKQIKVAVIDTGITDAYKHKSGLCKSGHFNFVTLNNEVRDTDGHGTNISGLIHKHANRNDYCQLVYMYYDEKGTSTDNAKRMSGAIKMAIKNKVDFINISGGGNGYIAEEAAAIKQALDKGITVVAAAGNEGANLDNWCNYFPACYDSRIIVVGSLNKEGKRSEFSNYGRAVKHYVYGEDRCANGVCNRGTSQATAIVTGRLINKKGNRNVSNLARP